MKQDERLLSLDALRGFDMLFIMGFAGLVVAVCALWPGETSAAIARQMGHAQWNGLLHHDTIFPLFLFIAGISFPFSLAKQRANQHSTKQIALRIIRRGLILVLLGMVYNNFFALNFATFRVASVLARIGLAWMFAALIYLFFGTRTSAVATVVILIGYALLITYVGAPDRPIAGHYPLSFEGNLVGWVDRQWLPGHLYKKTFDPEGLLSTVPAIATAILGVLTGDFLKTDRWHHSKSRKALYLFLAAVAITLIGVVWNNWLPINKNLWTSSFVCVVAGYSLGMMSLFYYLIDVRGWTRWTLFFRVIGLNSITIYLAQRIIGFQKISDFFLGGLAAKCPTEYAHIINSVGYITVCWLFLYFLYKKKVFLKV